MTSKPKRNSVARTFRKPTQATKRVVSTAAAQEVLPDFRVVPTSAVVKTSKSAEVVALMQRADGATIEEMVAATGWLAHTTRAMLSGLKKKGRTLTSEKSDGVRRYRIIAEQGAGA